MNKPQGILNVRLAIGGFSDLVLIAWMAFAPKTIPALVASPSYAPDPLRTIVTGSFCGLILGILAPVVFLGSWRQRSMALLVAMLPALVLAYVLYTSLGGTPPFVRP